MIDLYEAKLIVKNRDGLPPMTDNARTNFLIDVAQQKVVMDSDVAMGAVQISDWEDVKEEYEREVEAYQEDDDIEPYTVEEIKQMYLSDE